MRRLYKLILILFAFGMIIPVATPDVSAQGLKIGFVRDEQIKNQYRAWGKAQDQWDIEARAWEDEALSKQEELRELTEEFERQKLILSEEKRAEKEAAIGAKTDALDAFTRQVYGPNGTAERKQSQLLQPLIEAISNAIEAVAIAEDYDVIFTLQSGLGYIKEDYDMTSKVLQYLEDNE